LNLKAILEVIGAVREYLFPYEKLQKKFNSVNNFTELKIFIKERSALVTQTTLYGYLKTRMGLKQHLMFTDDVFVESVNKSKWHIFSECVSDLTLYTLSYLKNFKGVNNLDPQEIYEEILDNEKNNGIPNQLVIDYKKKFSVKVSEIDLKSYMDNDPFKASGLSLYDWSPIADELKILDKEIVLNSIKNKWNLVISDFKKLSANYSDT